MYLEIVLIFTQKENYYVLVDNLYINKYCEILLSYGQFLHIC